MTRFLTALLLGLGLVGPAQAQRFPGYPPANSFYVGNGATRNPSWFAPAAARTAIGLATWAVPAGIVPMANGGAGVALTPSAGGIVYSGASTLAILPGTVTAGLCLQSGSSAAPVWASCTAGAAVVSAVSNANGTLTISPTTGAVVASLNLGNVNTWTAVQTFSNGALRLLGSSTGGTTFTSANASATNFTLTVPAITSTLAVLGANQTFTGVQTFSGTLNDSGVFQIAGNVMTFPATAATLAALNLTGQLVSGGANVTPHALGTISSGTVVIDCGQGQQQFLTNNGPFTLAAPITDGACNVQVTNGATAGAITFSGFSVNAAYVGITMTTAISNKYLITINRNNTSSVYFVVPQQ